MIFFDFDRKNGCGLDIRKVVAILKKCLRENKSSDKNGMPKVKKLAIMKIMILKSCVRSRESRRDHQKRDSKNQLNLKAQPPPKSNKS